MNRNLRLILAAILVIIVIVALGFILRNGSSSVAPSPPIAGGNTNGETVNVTVAAPQNSSDVNNIVVTLFAQTAVANVTINVLTPQPSVPEAVAIAGTWDCNFDVTFELHADGSAILTALSGSHSGSYTYDKSNNVFQFTGYFGDLLGVGTKSLETEYYRVLALTAKQFVIMPTVGGPGYRCDRAG